MPDSLYGNSVPISTQQSGMWTLHGAASFHDAVDDPALDGFVRSDLSTPRGVPRDLRYAMAPLAAPFGIEKVRFVRIAAQAFVNAGSNSVRGEVITPNGVAPFELAINSVAPAISLTTVDLGSGPAGPWTLTDLSDMQVNLLPRSVFSTVSIFEFYFQLWYNETPTATPSGPGTVTSTSFPLLSWTYADPESDPQDQIEVKLFTGAAGVADPSTETERLYGHTPPMTYSGTSIRSPGLWNGSYRWAARAKDTGSGAFGDWRQAGMTVALNFEPDPPVLIVTPEPELARYHIIIGDAGGGTQGFILQRSDDYGATWVDVRGASQLNPVYYVGTPVQLYDYEAVRMARSSTAPVMTSIGYNEPVNYNAPINYNESVVVAGIGPPNAVRYRAWAFKTFGGEVLWGDPTVVTPESLIGRDVRLKHPHDPDRNLLVQQLADFTSTSEEDLAALRAVGRADWVVFGDVPSLEKGELSLIFPGDSVWLEFEKLRGVPEGSASPVLLQTCFGDTILDQMWIRLGPNRSITRVTHTDQQVKQYRRCAVGFFQTIRPAEVI